MYFASRVQAGRMLAAKLVPKYHDQKCAIMALGDGGAMVGAQIALQLHCVLTLLQSAEIGLPREPDALAAITSGGALSYNHSFSDGELDEMTSEYFGLIEQQKMLRMHELNHLVGSGGTLNKAFLKDHVVIVVSDGLKTGFAVDLAVEFLKPIAIEKLIIATPFAGVKAVDRMHVQADELYCLSVIAEYMDTDHYYDQQDVPDHKTVLETIEHLMLNWK
jgi:putative phosphoribosyl transferase